MSTTDIVDMAELPSDRPYVFARNWWKNKPMIMLLRQEGNDTCTKLWSRGFDEVNDQAAMFYWLCGHVDNWPFWGAIAATQGADELSEVLDAVRRNDEYWNETQEW